MSLQITGRNIDIGQSLPKYIGDSMKELISKYFQKYNDGRVIIEKDGNTLFQVEIYLHINKHITVSVKGSHSDVYDAYKSALTKATKILRRKKSQFIDNHHK